MASQSTSQDRQFLQQAFNLAKKGRGWTNPHPMVGAIVVKKGKIIAKGYHRRFGADHAEMDALKRASADVKDGIMYVTLEPCHLPNDLSGRRVPCVEVIKKAGIKKVHIAMLDPNPEVSGKGRMTLEREGIKTTLGLLGREVSRLNEAYYHFMTKHLPFVALTFSASLDGKIASESGDSQWIINHRARRYARWLRGVYQAVVVGINTILKDNPHLGVRQKGMKDPLRIVLDSTLKIPLPSQVLRDSNVIIITTKRANKEKKQKLLKKGITVLDFDTVTISVKDLLRELYKRKFVSILVEGGGKTLGSFVDEKLVDKVYVFHSPMIIGGNKAVSAVGGKGAKTVKQAMFLGDLSSKKFGDNWLTIGYPRQRDID